MQEADSLAAQRDVDSDSASVEDDTGYDGASDRDVQHEAPPLPVLSDSDSNIDTDYSSSDTDSEGEGSGDSDEEPLPLQRDDHHDAVALARDALGDGDGFTLQALPTRVLREHLVPHLRALERLVLRNSSRVLRDAVPRAPVSARALYAQAVLRSAHTQCRTALFQWLHERMRVPLSTRAAFECVEALLRCQYWQRYDCTPPPPAPLSDRRAPSSGISFRGMWHHAAVQWFWSQWPVYVARRRIGRGARLRWTAPQETAGVLDVDPRSLRGRVQVKSGNGRCWRTLRADGISRGLHYAWTLPADASAPWRASLVTLPAEVLRACIASRLCTLERIVLRATCRTLRVLLPRERARSVRQLYLEAAACHRRQYDDAVLCWEPSADERDQTALALVEWLYNDRRVPLPRSDAYRCIRLDTARRRAQYLEHDPRVLRWFAQRWLGRALAHGDHLSVYQPLDDCGFDVDADADHRRHRYRRHGSRGLFVEVRRYDGARLPNMEHAPRCSAESDESDDECILAMRRRAIMYGHVDANK